MIAAMTHNRVIGKNNKIPWHIPGEQKRFKQETWGHTLIMGRKTFESIGNPLPGRRNIVITRKRDYQAVGCEITYSLKDALALCKTDERIFVIGGEQLFRQSMDIATKIILSVIEKKCDGDTFFPEISENDFNLTNIEKIDKPAAYKILTYTRK